MIKSAQASMVGVAGLALVGAFVLACASAGTVSAVMLPPPDPSQKGIDLYKQGQYAQAEAALRGVKGAEAQAYLAGSLAKQGKFQEGADAARAAVAANPTQPVAVEALGESLVGLKQYDAAINAMSQALAKKNDLAFAYYWRGKAYNEKKQTARMVDDFQAFVKLAPKAPEAVAVKRLLAALR